MAQSTQGVGCEPSFLLICTLGGSRQCWGSLPPMGEIRLEFLAPGSSMIQPWLLQACGSESVDGRSTVYQTGQY